MPRRTPAGSPKTAIAYLRVSTEQQELGPDAQRAAIAAWAARAGVTIAAWYFDEGVSGGASIDKRAALLDALAALETYGAGTLVVAKRDRLARDTMAAIAIEGLATKAGARIVSAAGEGTDADADDPAAFILRRMLDVFAEYERLVIKARTRAAMRVKMARGETTGQAPFGFRADESGKLVASAEEQSLLAEVRALRARGLSTRAIAAELAARGRVSRVGGRIGKSQIARWLLQVAA